MSTRNFEFTRVAEKEVPDIFRKVENYINGLEAAPLLKNEWAAFIASCATESSQDASAHFKELVKQTRDMSSEDKVGRLRLENKFDPEVPDFIGIGNLYNLLSYVEEMGWENDFINQASKA